MRVYVCVGGGARTLLREQAWRKRACVLEGQALRYYKGSDTGSPQGVVSLERSTTVTCTLDVDSPSAVAAQKPTDVVEFTVRGGSV